MSYLVQDPANPYSIFERLRFENPWWISGQIDPDYEKMPRRMFFGQFYQLVAESSVNRAVVVMGPRRVGKTVMMHHAISQLLAKGVPSKKIAFINIENPLFLNLGLEQIFKYCLDATSDHDPSGWYIFFDEIQYLKDWEIHLTTLVNSYRKTRFVVSGSAAATLRQKSQESGAGRFTDYKLPCLTFAEYIKFINLESLMNETGQKWMNGNTFYGTTHIRELNKHFIEYINFGGFPEMIFSGAVKSNPSRYIRSDIIDKVLLRDLPSIYGIENVQMLNKFFSVIAFNTGSETTFQNISTLSGINKKTILNYLTFLESSFLIKTIQRLDDTARQFKRADYFKIYITNPSIRTALFTPLESTDEEMGKMTETTIFAQLLHNDRNLPHYARWTKGRFQGEVDMIGMDARQLKPQWVSEIKWSNYYVTNPHKLESLIAFCQTNELQSAIVTSIDMLTSVHHKGIELQFIPAALYAYNAGMMNAS